MYLLMLKETVHSPCLLWALLSKHGKEPLLQPYQSVHSGYFCLISAICQLDKTAQMRLLVVLTNKGLCPEEACPIL